MHIADFKQTKYYISIDIVMVGPDLEVGFIHLTPRWRKIASVLREQVSTESGQKFDDFDLMHIEVIDIFKNNFCQNSSLYRITFGRKLCG